ncbi:GNAT family N-acetyltransferase [Acidocella sp.]|uniref:GNAT family N-acetyltransferase n=1 Tax=Acidocella sp. TaxID=50710 RepID=UPI0038D0C9E8
MGGMADQTFPEARIYSRIAEIGQEAWDGCASSGNPFTSYAFLSALEDSGSVGEGTGWHPRYLALGGPGGAPAAVAPAYAKTHSYGEYVFDQGWAQAFTQAGGRYYPKLQVAAPFSPVPGPRLLGRASPAEMAAALEAARAARHYSSVHVTFCTRTEWEELGAAGWLRRLGMQFHWENRAYADFEAFLAALSSRKRKAVRRERREAREGLQFRTLHGPEITPGLWRVFYEFYLSTVERKWGGAYLTPEFFPLLGARLGGRVVLMLAERNGRPVAGALNLLGEGVLYGRNWGAVEDVPFLHFELCYYQAIEYAIAHGLARVEAGAQGEHKIQRGYLPRPTYSAHFIAHRGLREAVARFLEVERREIAAAMVALEREGPYRQDGG